MGRSPRRLIYRQAGLIRELAEIVAGLDRRVDRLEAHRQATSNLTPSTSRSASTV